MSDRSSHEGLLPIIRQRPSWHANSSSSSRDICEHDGIGADHRTIPNPDSSEYFRPRTYINMPTEDRRSLTDTSTDGHAGEDEAIGTDYSVLMNYDSRWMGE